MRKRMWKRLVSIVCVMAMVGSWSASAQTQKGVITSDEPISVAEPTVSTLPQNIQMLLENAEQTDVVIPSDNPYELTVRHADDTYTTEVYSVPVKYTDAEGKTQYVDTSMQERTLWQTLTFNDTRYNQEGFVALAYDEDIDDGVSVDEAFTLSVPVRDEQESARCVTAEDGSGKIIYPQAFGEHTYVEYINTYTGFKENIVLEQNIGQNTFDFVWESDTHVPVLIDDNKAIKIVQKNNRQQADYTISPLYVYDSFDPTTSDDPYSHKHWTEDCRYDIIEKEDGTYIIRAIVSEEYLNHPETVYPVVIDPSVTANSAASNVHDGYVMESDGKGYCGYEYLRFGYSGGKIYSYVDFVGLPTLPAGSYFSSAKFKVTFRTGQNTPANMQATARNCTSTFYENSLTWNNRPSLGSITSSVLPVVTDGYLDYYDFTITSMVKEWYTKYNNCGLMFTYQNQTYNDYNSVVSSDGDASRAPKLTLNYSVGTSETSGITDDGYYFIRNRATDKYLTLSEGGMSVELADYTGASNQLWQMQYQGNGGYYLVPRANMAQCLRSGVDMDGGAVGAYAIPSASDSAYERNACLFRITFMGTDRYRFASYATSAFYATTGGREYDTDVCVYTYTGATDQQWYFEEYSLSLSSNSATLDVGETQQFQLNTDALDVTWSSSDSIVASVSIRGVVRAKAAGVTTITVTCASDPSIYATCEVSVNQVLDGADVYITDPDIRETIINAKNMIDIANNMYLSGSITYEQCLDIRADAQYAANLARADHIVVNDQSDFAYQYFQGRNYQNGDVSPFNRDLVYDESSPMYGVDVMVVQRGMQAMGIFEPDEDYEYGTYDLKTYEAAAAYPNLLLNGKFDAESYRGIFNITTSSTRTPQWLLNLQEYSRQHRVTQLAVAGRALANIEVPIKGGGPSGVYAGRADVLRDYGEISHIWEIKHYNTNNLQIGNNQLNRYLTAASSFEQDFSLPLQRGYGFDLFYVPYSATTCLEVSSTAITGLIFYREVPIPSPTPTYADVPFPEAQKEYEYQLKPIPLETAVVVGLTIVCIAGTIYVASTTGVVLPLKEAIRGLSLALSVAPAVPAPASS